MKQLKRLRSWIKKEKMNNRRNFYLILTMLAMNCMMPAYAEKVVTGSKELPLEINLLVDSLQATNPENYKAILPLAMNIDLYARSMSKEDIFLIGKIEVYKTLLKNYAAANQLLQRCIELGISENIEAYYTELGDNLAEMKKYSLAQRNYDTARYHSGNVELLYRKGLAYDAAKQDVQAKTAYAGYLKNAKKGDSAMINYAKSRVGK